MTRVTQGLQAHTAVAMFTLSRDTITQLFLVMCRLYLCGLLSIEDVEKTLAVVLVHQNYLFQLSENEAD